MPPTYLTFPALVQNFVNAFCGQLGLDPNLQPGSGLLAIAESDAAQGIALETMSAETVAFSRAQTSFGPDLDSFYAQFKFPRLPALAASGTVNFSAGIPATQQVNIPVGAIVQTQGGAISYQVIADPNAPAFNLALNAYILPVGQTSINVTMAAIVPGSLYNVQSGQLQVLVSSVFGVKSVTNVAAIINGQNSETDTAYRARFIDYLQGLSRATKVALLSAVLNLQVGLKVALLENVQLVGNPPTSENSPYYGNIVALVDDGSGAPSTGLLNAATAAIISTIAFGVQYQVLPPAVLHPHIATTVKVGPNGIDSVVQTNVANAIIDYINNLPIGATVYLENIVAIAKDADANVVAVVTASTTINSLQEDLVLTDFQEALVTLSNVAVTTV